MAGRKRAAQSEASPSKSAKKPKPLEQDPRFGGMTEEECCKLLLPDHMTAGLDIIFVSFRTFL